MVYAAACEEEGEEGGGAVGLGGGGEEVEGCAGEEVGGEGVERLGLRRWHPAPAAKLPRESTINTSNIP